MIAYWLINVPLMILLSIKPLNFGFTGLWISITIAQIYLVPSNYYNLNTTNWEERAKIAKERRDEEKADKTA